MCFELLVSPLHNYTHTCLWLPLVYRIRWVPLRTVFAGSQTFDVALARLAGAEFVLFLD